MYQQAGSKAGAWIDRRVPLFKRIGGAFKVLDTVTKVVAGGATVAALLFGGGVAEDKLFTDSSGPCPKGWSYNEAYEGDAVRRTCYQSDSGWSVLLAPNSNTCESALNTKDPNAKVVDCAQVPGW